MRRPVQPLYLLAIALFPLSAACQLHKGENLLQPVPLPEGQWLAAQSTKGRDEIIDWTQAGTEDRAKTVILHNQGGYPPARFREINFKGGRESCANFDGQVLDEKTPTNGYGRSIWIGRCTQNDGSKVVALWLFISGHDSSYFIYRQWRGEPDSNALNTWVKYLQGVTVCDTRKRKNASCEPA